MTASAQVEEPFEGATPEEVLWLDQTCEANAYFCPVIMPRHQYAAIHRFIFTWGIIVGDLFDDCGYSGRWCFDTFPAAAVALAAWRDSGFIGEPSGWHRHPDTGRRRPEGDASREYVTP